MMFLALAALWVQLLVPQGFMVANSATGPNLVICTGHGPLDLSVHGHPGKAPASKSNAACVFAGHGLSDKATADVTMAPSVVAYAAPAQRAVSQAAPGYGLAAPPPPARGPPQV